MAAHRNALRQDRCQLPRLRQARCDHALAQMTKLSLQPSLDMRRSPRSELVREVENGSQVLRFEER
ncbi:hypothetical protein RFM98_30680 [Mesorhizobium sp. VK9D]|nr:hypothetical protein [Mesorhizobium sp. VK9D]MDX8457104.1 hypothetical protein [Mesorhizobium sp. VK9D]